MNQSEMFTEYRRRNRAFSDDYFYDPGVARTRVKTEMGLSLTAGHPGLTELLIGSALSMVDRVLPNGALVESFGEIGGGYRYDGVFCRSIGEYVWPACALGRADLAATVLRFVLEHTPWGQVYAPHTFRFDGTIYMNVMQVDSIGHAFYGMYHLWLFTGDLSLFRQYKHHFDNWLQALTWLLLPEFNLVHSGNSNENVDGSSETMCELFTNCTILYGCRCLAKLMDAVGDTARSRTSRELADQIREGIETHLKSGNSPMYQVGFWVSPDRKKRPVPESYFKWLNTYSLRFMPDADVAALRTTHETLVRRSLTDFGKYRVPIGYLPPNYELIGKYAGWSLGYTAQTGRMHELETLLRFAGEYTRKPRDIWPEAWLLKANWLDQAASHRNKPWVNFADDPDGDYTMDSGNAEQLILSMEHLARHVFGADLRQGKPGIHPAFPLDWDEVAVDGLTLPDGTGAQARVGYTLKQGPHEALLNVTRMPTWEMEISLPVQKHRPVRITLDDVKTPPSRREPGIEADRVVVTVRNKASLRLEICYGGT